MELDNRKYKAIVSSDWSECLAPCGPFDFISFNYPELTSRLKTIFKQYTGNRISLGEASKQIQEMLPDPIYESQMDAYLDHSFSTYNGVPQLIEWCLSRDILFMINTTGMVGYFQRIFAKGLIPKIPLLSAHPMIRYPKRNSDPDYIYNLFEIRDKAKNTMTAIKAHQIPPDKIIIMGDSGGDGPHFEWGARIKAFLIGSMTKPSLENYCRTRNIRINFKFGPSLKQSQPKELQEEIQVNFMDLSSCIKEVLA